MRNDLIILILAMMWFCSCQQKNNSKTKKISIESEIEPLIKVNNLHRYAFPELEKFIYTDTTYEFSAGEEVIIQNSFPRGGMIEPNGTQYFDSSGKSYFNATFWTRIINKTTIPLEVNIAFPADSLAIFSVPDTYLKLFLPTDTMTFDKLELFNYGITDLKSYLDVNLNKASMLRRTIYPNKEYVFYIVALCYQLTGKPRAALILKEQDLYYNMSMEPNGYGTISVGQISLKEKNMN